MPTEIDIEKAINRVHAIVGRIQKRLPSSVDKDELVSSGYLGLCQCIDTYRVDRHASFNTYAEYRISGAIMDYLRSEDDLKRSHRDILNQIDRVQSEYYYDTGDQAPLDYIAEKLGVDVAKVEYAIGNRIVPTIQLDAEMRGEGGQDNALFHDVVANKDRSIEDVVNDRMMVQNMVKCLSERDRLILQRFYYEDCTMSHIANELGLSETIISNSLKGSHKKMRRMLIT